MTRPRSLPLPLVLAAGLWAGPARAHHGVAAVGAAGPEGPGAALETTSPLPLPQGLLFAMARTEYVPFQRFTFAEPRNKAYAWFNTLALGYGLVPWLSAYVFQPYSVKAQDGAGTNAGPGDTSVMLSAGFKYDERFQLVPEKESLDDLMDWHLGIWASATVPVGPTSARDRSGAYFAPDMQTAFGAAATAGGLTVMKQLSSALTWLAEASWQSFRPATYGATPYRFGDEVRLNSAAVYRVYGSGRLRLDACGELNGLHLAPDHAQDPAGAWGPVGASGGTILYAGGGIRAYDGPLTVALGVKRAALKRLDEQARQQGSEGLELLRAFLTLSWSTRVL